MTQKYTYLISSYTGKIYHRDDFRLVEMDLEQLEAVHNMPVNQRRDFAANNGRFIPKGEQ